MEAERAAPPRLSVVLVHWRAADWCRSAVASLLDSEGVALRITVIDNSADDEPFAPGPELAGDERLEVVAAPGNIGFTGAANLGLGRRFAAAEELCLLGSHDLHVAADCLVRLLTAAAAHPRFGVLGPDLPGGPPLAGDGGDAAADGIEPCAWISGTAMLVRRGCFLAVGGFDEDLGSYREDVDLCARARRAGWSVGRVRGAAAHGLGTRSPHARALDRANDLLLRAKHRSSWALAKGVAWQLFSAARHLARATAAPAGQRALLMARGRDDLRAIPLGLRKVMRWSRRRN